MSEEEITFHIIPDKYCPPNRPVVLCALSDLVKIKELMGKHFEAYESIHYEDGWPTGYIQKIGATHKIEFKLKDDI
jgi:hypothetical protein